MGPAWRLILKADAGRGGWNTERSGSASICLHWKETEVRDSPPFFKVNGLKARLLDFPVLLFHCLPFRIFPKNLGQGLCSLTRSLCDREASGLGLGARKDALRCPHALPGPAPAPDTGRTFPGCRSCGGNSGIRSHLLPPAPEPNPGGRPRSRPASPLEECES